MTQLFEGSLSEAQHGPDTVGRLLEQSTQAPGLRAIKTELDRKIARSLAVLLGLVMLGALAQLLAMMVQTEFSWPQRLQRMSTGLAVFLLAAVTLALGRRHGIRQAAGFFALGGLGVLLLGAAAHGNGVMSSGMPALAALIVILGTLVGPRQAKWGTWMAVLGLSALWLAERSGWIPGLSAHNTPPLNSYLVVYVVTCLVAGWLTICYGRMFWDATRAIEQSRDLLAEALTSQQTHAAELRAVEARLRSLLDQSFTAIQIHDGATGALRYANAQALEKYGCNELRDLTDAMLYPNRHHSREQALARLKQTLQDGAQYFQWQSERRDGTPIWWDIKLDRIQLGDELCVVSYQHDITARVQAERQLTLHKQRLVDEVRERTVDLLDEKLRMQEIIEALPITLSIRDAKGRFTLVNRQFEQALELHRDQVLGRRPDDVFDSTLAAELNASDEHVLNGLPMVNDERQFNRRDGVHDYLMTTAPICDAQGKPYAVLNLGTDVTPLKRLQRELSAARDEAERLAAVKSEFLSNMSHEIRTPLNAVLGLAQLGAQRAHDPRACADSFRRIVVAGGHLLGVINDILDFSKLDGGKLEVDPVPTRLAQLLSQVMDLVSQRAQEKGLSLRLDTAPNLPEWVALDGLRTSQILLNLLSNAVKFTGQGEVRLQVRVEGPQAQARLVFAVHDSGTGIAPDQIQRIFKAFEQADSSVTRKFGGTGLGLSISRRLARLMGGDISVHSELGLGSCFTLRLPLVLAESGPLGVEPGKGPEVQIQGALQGMHLLIADDVDINREILQDMLVHAGATVAVADGGAQAIAHLQAAGPDAFDVVLMDVQMPGMDGYEATAGLHAIEPELPVIALTAHALPEQRTRCLAAGMCSHLTKPIDPGLLVQTVLVYASRRHMARRASPLGESRPAALGPPPAPKAPPRPVAVATAQPSDEAWPDLPQTDFKGALARCAGRPALVVKLLSSFVQQYGDCPAALAEARRSQAAGADGALRSYAHRVKGIAANLGLNGLSSAAADLEARAADPEGSAEQAHALTVFADAMALHLSVLGAWTRERQGAAVATA